jgi:hypothetical protein
LERRRGTTDLVVLVAIRYTAFTTLDDARAVSLRGKRLFAHSETGTPMAESERARSLNELSERLEELRRHL